MDLATQILVATFAAIAGLLEDLAAVDVAPFGGVGVKTYKDGTVMISVRFHTGLWAPGDKAWRIAALAELVADYHDGRPKYQSFTNSGTNYREVHGSYLCKTPKEQRQCLEALATICTRTSERV